MEINLQTGQTQPPGLPSARSADTPVVKNADTAKPVTPAATVPPPKSVEPSIEQNAEEKRYQQLVNAAQNFFKDVYAVSDTTFTIYKDHNGQYVTRYTSLRDGKVTYVPEPRMLQYANQSRESLVEITA